MVLDVKPIEFWTFSSPSPSSLLKRLLNVRTVDYADQTSFFFPDTTQEKKSRNDANQFESRARYLARRRKRYSWQDSTPYKVLSI